MRLNLIAATLLLVAFTSGGCSDEATPPLFRPPTPPGPVGPFGIEHVVVVALDGVRPDVLATAHVPNIRELCASGSCTWNAWTTWPPGTLNGIPAIQTGASPEVHGVTSWQGTIKAETLSEVLAEAGLTSNLIGGESLLGGGRATYWTGFSSHERQDEHYAQVAIDRFQRYRPFYLYLYNPVPDHAAHTSGSGSQAYLAAIENADLMLGRLLAALKKERALDHTLIVVTTDHGITGIAHGYGYSTDMQVFSVWHGPGVRRGLHMVNDRTIPPMSAGRVRIGAHPVADSSWSEHTLKWSTQPRFGPAIAETEVRATGMISWDVTTALKGIPSPAASLSLALVQSTNEGDRKEAAFFDTKEWADASMRPVLRVEHEEGSEPISSALAPSHDVYVVAGQPDRNFAFKSNYYVGSFYDGEARAFVKFGLGELPGTAIRSATFEAYCWRQFPVGYPGTTVAHHLVDVAPTITSLLGLRPPRHATGTVIEQLLQPGM